MGRPNERITERNDGVERPWYGERFGETQNSNSGGTYIQRNGYDWQKMPESKSISLQRKCVEIVTLLLAKL